MGAVEEGVRAVEGGSVGAVEGGVGTAEGEEGWGPWRKVCGLWWGRRSRGGGVRTVEGGMGAMEGVWGAKEKVEWAVVGAWEPWRGRKCVCACCHLWGALRGPVGQCWRVFLREVHLACEDGMPLCSTREWGV